MLFLVLRQVFYVVLLFVADMLDIILGMVYYISRRIIDYAVVLLIGAGLFYLFVEYNPALQQRVVYWKNALFSKVESLTGLQIDIPSINIPGPEEVMDTLTREGSANNPNPLHPKNLHLDRLGMELPDVVLPAMQLPEIDIPETAMLIDVIGKHALPEPLHPLLEVVQDRHTLRQFRALADAGKLGKEGEGAIPLLQRSLYSSEPALRKASYQALREMKSPEARLVLRDYEKLIESIMHDARVGH